MTNPTLIISGGGTGGHIFPALAIADYIKHKAPKTHILFVGAKGKMEMDKIPQKGYPIVGLPIRGFSRSSFFKNISLPFRLIYSLLQCFRILKKHKPSIVVGVGGYASGPLLWVAQSLNIPTLIQEQNSYAGLTNKKLGKKATYICAAYQEVQAFFPNKTILHTGNPIRKEIRTGVSKKEALHALGLKNDKKTLFIMGGSLGAKSINQATEYMLKKIDLSEIQIIWQTGKLYYDTLKSRVPENQDIHLYPFIEQMAVVYAAADLVISRAGALSISELQHLAKPSILIPSPNVAEDHQTKNALALVKQKAAVLIPDHKAKENLAKVVAQTIHDNQALHALSTHIKQMDRPDALEQIGKILRSHLSA